MRTLPHSKEAELAVLAGILLRNDAFIEVSSLLDEDSFYVPVNRAVYRAMAALAGRSESIDPVTLEHQLRATNELGMVGGLEGLGKLADRYASSHHVANHAKIVWRKARLRRLILTAVDIADQGREDIEDIDRFINDSEQRVLEVNDGGRDVGYRHAKDLIHGVFESITERAKRKNPITGVPTGFHKLDEMTGGMQPGDLIILAARPSMGKTALALNLAQNACITQPKHQHLPEEERPPRYPVLVFSIEMSAGQLIERVICSEARVDAGRVRAGRIVEQEFRDMVSAADRLHKAPLYIDDSGSPTILEIRARARRFRQDRKLFPPIFDKDGKEDTKTKRLGLIVVDYLQLCRGGAKKYTSREQEISEVSRGLKALAKELELPVLALAQLNRGVDSRADHRPQLSDLRESGAIEQDSDVIAFIYREARYVTDEQERAKVERDAEVIIGKQRNGPTGTVNLIFRGEHTRFENPAAENP